jgi:hypothetical protein
MENKPYNCPSQLPSIAGLWHRQHHVLVLRVLRSESLENKAARVYRAKTREERAV